MLILARRTGESVMIGPDIQVTILGVKGNQVRMGILAPRDVAVYREEIYDRIRREEDAAPFTESGVVPADSAPARTIV